MKRKQILDAIKTTPWLTTLVITAIFFIMNYVMEGEYHGGVKPVCKSLIEAIELAGMISFIYYKIPRKWSGTNKISKLGIDVHRATFIQIVIKTIQDIHLWVIVWSVVYALAQWGCSIVLSQQIPLGKVISYSCFYAIITFCIDFFVILQQVFAQRRTKS